MTVSQLRTATRATAVQLQADGTNLTPTQAAAITKFIADIDAESALANASSIPLGESVASNIPYQLRDALEAIPVITNALTYSQTHGVAPSFSVTASHQPVSYAATYLGSSTLPSGLTFNTTTGAFGGVMPVAGTYAIVVTATNYGGTSAAATVTFTST
jgi:hypothetical protein